MDDRLTRAERASFRAWKVFNVAWVSVAAYAVQHVIMYTSNTFDNRMRDGDPDRLIGQLVVTRALFSVVAGIAVGSLVGRLRRAGSPVGPAVGLTVYFWAMWFVQHLDTCRYADCSVASVASLWVPRLLTILAAWLWVRDRVARDLDAP